MKGILMQLLLWWLFCLLFRNREQELEIEQLTIDHRLQTLVQVPGNCTNIFM